MNYWKECIEAAFEEAGIVATDEQIQAAANVVEGGHENYAMAHGYEAIPNPLTADVEKLKARIRQLEGERDRAELSFKKNVAMRHRCEVSDVEIRDDGEVIIH